MVTPATSYFSYQQRIIASLVLFLASLLLILRSPQPDSIDLCNQRRLTLQHLQNVIYEFTKYRHLERLASENTHDATTVFQAARETLKTMERHGKRLRIISKILQRRKVACGRSHNGNILRRLEKGSLFGWSPISGVMIVLMALIGTKEGKFVEFENARSEGVMFGIGGLISLAGWEGFIVCDKWSGYNRLHEVLEGELITKLAKAGLDRGGSKSIAERRGKKSSVDVEEELGVLGVGGKVDVLMLWLDRDEFDVWSRISDLRPRVVTVRFQDYWGRHTAVARTFLSNDPPPRKSHLATERGRLPVFAGASLPAFVALASRKGYVLVHCLEATPIALFLHHTEALGNINSISIESCFEGKAQNRKWRRNMEAQWDTAQYYNWKRL